MKKKIGKVLWLTFVVSVFLILTGEILLHLNLIGPKHKYHIAVKPNNFLRMDSVVGWRLEPGKYVISVWDTSNVFKVTINDQGNRITSSSDTIESSKHKPNIQIYGCSFTFGFSVSDSSTSCYKLQQMLPNARIENKGIPGYSLPQMYLSLKQNLMAGDTPDIVVFNYANFHDMRTPLCYSWSAILASAVLEGLSSKFKKMNYPYMSYSHDSLITHYCSFDDLPKDWSLSDKSSLVRIINNASYGLHDITKKKQFHFISQKTILDIAQYCRSNHITPIFASLTPENTDILDTLSSNGYYTLNYGIVVWDKYKANQYNCAPMDPEHPNGLAHTIYAQKLYNLIQKKKLLSIP